MGLRERWGELDTFLDSGWGWAILLGFAAAMAYILLVFIVDDPNTRNMKRLLTSVEGREPTRDEAQQLTRDHSRMTAVVSTEFVLMLLVVGAMAAARFV